MSTALDQAERLSRLTSGASRADVTLLRIRAELEMARGRDQLARDLAEGARQLAEELGLVLLAVNVDGLLGRIAFQAGDTQRAVRLLSSACQALEEMGDTGHLVSLLPHLGDALFEAGRMEELAARLEQAPNWMMDEDTDAQIGARRGQAKLHASRGDLTLAESLAREALARAEQTDCIPLHCEVLRDLATILALAGARDDAAAVLDVAADLYRDKGSVGQLERIRAAADALRPSPG